MTTKPRELSVDRYNFYSSKETPLPDEKVASLHGMSLDELEDWKVKNGLTQTTTPAEKKAPIKQVSIQEEGLTVTLYEKYKSGEKPLSDAAIQKKHDMTTADMQKFKREHKLIGKFNAHKPGKANGIKQKVEAPSVEAPIIPIVKAFREMGNNLSKAFAPISEVKPLREKEIAKERLSQTINAFQAAKEEPAIGSLSVGDPTPQQVNISTAEGYAVAPVGMQKVEVPESLELKWLKEELEKMKTKMDELNKDRYEIIARADMWRDKCRVAEALLKEQEHATEKLKQQHDIEIRNLQNDLSKAEEVIITYRQDEQLLFQTMKKLVSVSGRLDESLEGSKDLWR